MPVMETSLRDRAAGHANRRRWPLRALVVVSLVVLGGLAAWQWREQRPNVVVVVIDTLRADHLPTYGYARNTAPFLAELASRSVTFEAAQSASAWTAPATASIFTSLYPFQHGVTTGFMVTERLQEGDASFELNRIPDELETMPEAMKRAGYSTWAVTGNVNIGAAMGFFDGFDFHHNFSQDMTAKELSAKVERWKPRLEEQAPYFLYVHYLDPHAPYRPNKPWFDPATEGLARRISAYDSEIAFTDSMIGALYRSFGWDRDTIVVVTSDHGEEFGDHGGKGHSETLYSEMLSVPLIVSFPGGEFAGRRIQEPVGTIDVLPTLRELVGLPPDLIAEGRSLMPLLRAAAPPSGARPLFSHLLRVDQGNRWVRAVRRGEWKLIESATGGLLFNLRRDPGEKIDGRGEEPRIANLLEQELRRFVDTSRKFSGRGSATLDAEAVETLRSLGYVR